MKRREFVLMLGAGAVIGKVLPTVAASSPLIVEQPEWETLAIKLRVPKAYDPTPNHRGWVRFQLEKGFSGTGVNYPC